MRKLVKSHIRFHLQGGRIAGQIMTHVQTSEELVAQWMHLGGIWFTPEGETSSFIPWYAIDKVEIFEQSEVAS